MLVKENHLCSPHCRWTCSVGGGERRGRAEKDENQSTQHQRQKQSNAKYIFFSTFKFKHVAWFKLKTVSWQMGLYGPS